MHGMAKNYCRSCHQCQTTTKAGTFKALKRQAYCELFTHIAIEMVSPLQIPVDIHAGSRSTSHTFPGYRLPTSIKTYCGGYFIHTLRIQYHTKNYKINFTLTLNSRRWLKNLSV